MKRPSVMNHIRPLFHGVRLGLLGLACAFALATTPALAQSLNGFDLRNALVPADQIERGGPPRDGIPAIDNPRFVRAALSRLRDDDRVLGIARAGVVRAYPVRILNWHEVVNDRIGDEGVVVTYCPLCGTGVAFEAPVGAERVLFGVSGLLYNSDVLLYDRKTESLWSQILSRAVSGPRKGAALRRVPLTHTSWGDWRQRHPESSVLSFDTGFARDCDRDPYAGYENVQRLMFKVAHRDERVLPKAWVLDVERNGQFKAYPFSALAVRADAQGRLEDRVGGEPVTIRYNRQHRSAEAFDARGQALAAITSFWFAWVAFHPDTELLQ